MLDPGFFPYVSRLVFGLFLFLYIYIYKSFWARILKALLSSVDGLGWAAVDCFCYGFSWCNLVHGLLNSLNLNPFFSFMFS